MNSRIYLVLIGVLIILIIGEVFVWLSAKEVIKTFPLKPSKEMIKPESGTTQPAPLKEPPEVLVYSAKMMHLFREETLGEVMVIENPFTGDYEYQLTLTGLKLPEPPAHYEVWFVHAGDIVSSQGKLAVNPGGEASLTFLGLKPNLTEGEAVGVTFEQDDSTPAPGKLIIEGVLEEVRE